MAKEKKTKNFGIKITKKTLMENSKVIFYHKIALLFSVKAKKKKRVKYLI